MATRALIARKTETGWEGCYHHWDGYPSGLGATLHELWNGHFNKDTGAMMKFLLDDHRGGWSNINGVDFTLPAGYGSAGPQCYCHGERSEGPYDFFTNLDEDFGGAEFCYVLSGDSMVILERWRNGHHGVSAFGYDWGGNWKQLAEVNLNEPVSDWDNI